MSTISTVTDRADGEVLTAAKYNADHGVHEQNAANLNADKVEIDNFNNEHGPTGAHSADEVRDSIGLATNDAVRFRVVTSDTGHILGYDFISSATATNDSSVDFTKLGATYDHYILTWKNVKPGTDSVNMTLKVGTGDAPAWQDGSQYAFHTEVRSSVADAENVNRSTGTSAFNIATSIGTGDREVQSGRLVASGLRDIRTKNFQWESTGVISDANFRHYSGGGIWNSSEAVTSLRIIMSSGNISSGDFALYAMRKS